MRFLAFCALLVSVCLPLVGCDSSTPPTSDREGKLLTLAAGEAQQIKDCDQRLTRQLNFAFRQMGRGKKDEAKQSLAYAAQTLKDAKPGDLHPQIRIAGWISISELSRGIDDKTTAQVACDQAVTVLRTLDPVAERPDYVIGVASEVQALQGKPAAAKLLDESADWVRQMHGLSTQRIALAAICDAIFDDDDYPGGLAVLRTDADATWRSDTLAMLAERPNSVPGSSVSVDVARNVIGGSPSFIDPSEMYPSAKNTVSDAASGTVSGFGKRVDFQSVFAGRAIGANDSSTKP
jgi:hypothetical protein